MAGLRIGSSLGIFFVSFNSVAVSASPHAAGAFGAGRDVPGDGQEATCSRCADAKLVRRCSWYCGAGTMSRSTCTCSLRDLSGGVHANVTMRSWSASGFSYRASRRAACHHAWSSITMLQYTTPHLVSQLPPTHNPRYTQQDH
jgi:hypothetical protein